MNDKSSLLGQLKIDRGGMSTAETGGAWRWWAGGGVAAVAIALVAFFIFAGPSGVPVKAALARAAVAEGSTVGASLLDASGYVVAHRKATVSAKTTGKLAEVLIEEGQSVAAGQILARLDDSNVNASLAQAEAQVRQAEASQAAAQVAYENARPLYERNKQLVGRGNISANVYEASKTAFDAAQANLAVTKHALEVAQATRMVAQRYKEDTVVRAPFAGVITVKAAQPGEIVSPSSAGGGFTRTGIGTIVDMDSLEVQVDVSENFISRVHANQAATIRLNAYPDWQIPGEIIAVIPTADRAKATVQVRVAIKVKNDPRIIPEMGARVSFLSEVQPQEANAPKKPAASGVIVSADAVQGTGDTGTVFLIRDNKVEKRSVKLGAKNADGQTILSGVTAGDRLAVGDFSQLSDGAKIKVE
jgi:RND family efflux transporter MFP subunit